MVDGTVTVVVEPSVTVLTVGVVTVVPEVVDPSVTVVTVGVVTVGVEPTFHVVCETKIVDFMLGSHAFILLNGWITIGFQFRINI